MGRKQQKVWLWLAVERASHSHCWYHTDEWPAHAAVRPPHAHRRDEVGQTNLVEALNCSLRQRCGVLVRKSCSFSKSLNIHHARIKIVIDQRNASITLS